MTYFWKDARSILSLVKEATDKLYEIEITPKMKQVLPLIGQIVDFVGRFTELSPDERHQVDHLCMQVDAYICVTRVGRLSVVLESESPEDLLAFRRGVKETRQLVEIGTDFFNSLFFDLPLRIDDDLIDDIKKIIELCKSKLYIVFCHHLPLEIAPVISTLKDIRISVKSLFEFETALAALDTVEIPPDLSLTFREISLETPITVLAMHYITKLLRSKSITVIIPFIFIS
jgi:hypothetical protein